MTNTNNPSIRERVNRARKLKIKPPATPPARYISYKDEGRVLVPGDISKSTYYTRRSAGKSHEEAIDPRRHHAKAADLDELVLPGSRPPRKKRMGEPLRAWQAREGEETPDQLAAMAKYGVK